MGKREFPEFPMVGVGGVLINAGRVLLVRRNTDPARGEWTIPGGLLEVGETLVEGVARELLEETGLTVRVVELIEALERIFIDAAGGPRSDDSSLGRPRYHYVILDYLCEYVSGEPQANTEVMELAFVGEEELDDYRLTPAAMRVLQKAFAMARRRSHTTGSSGSIRGSQ